MTVSQSHLVTISQSHRIFNVARRRVATLVFELRLTGHARSRNKHCTFLPAMNVAKSASRQAALLDEEQRLLDGVS